MTALFFHHRVVMLLLLTASSSVVTAFTTSSSRSCSRSFGFLVCPQREEGPKTTTTTSQLAATAPEAAASSSSSSSVTTTPMAYASQPPIIINGINLVITPALDEYVRKRIGRALSKFSGSVITECDVVLSVSKNPKVKSGHRVEIVTDIKGTTIICKNQSPDMYESIDLAAHALQRKLVKYKERRNEGYHGGLAMGEDLRAALEALEAEATAEDEAAAAAAMMSTKTNVGAAAGKDPEDDAFFYEETASSYKKTVTPVKSFQLDRPISLEEAIFALDYVDHDFYVFRNQDTKEINVVYKRHTGGIGLVAPEESSA